MKSMSVATLAAFAVLASAPVQARDPITAQEVTDRPTLRAFVEAARDWVEGATLSQITRVRDDWRAEGPWKASPLFLVAFMKNGTVLVHGDDPTVENRDALAVEDERGRPVVREMLAAAERGGGFVDYRFDGIDRVAYAVEVISPLDNSNRVVLTGGFAQDLSSVPVEITPLPRPEVTAAEVVDRGTLATFVKAAAKAYRDAWLTPDFSGYANMKNAFRQEGGDWRSGSVYLYVISTDGYTLFHGAQPVRFEGRRFEDIDRQDVNGVFYLREVLAAGKAGGGYVEYMFDNPAVEGDEEIGSPKIAYVTSFRMPGKDEIFIVGSGIYP